MRTTVDIPDAIYRQLKSDAAMRGSSVRELILERITKSPPQQDTQESGHFTFPAIESRDPGSLKLGPEGVYEYIPFP